MNRVCVWKLNPSIMILIADSPYLCSCNIRCCICIVSGVRGFESSVEGFDLNAELQAVAAAAPPGEDGPEGEP